MGQKRYVHEHKSSHSDGIGIVLTWHTEHLESYMMFSFSGNSDSVPLSF